MLQRFTWYWQSAFKWADDQLTVYIDPRKTGDDAPPADLILITHAHADHFQPDDISRLLKDGTKLVAPHDVAAELSGDVTPVAPGESHVVGGVHFSTVPAYNVVEHRLEAHPKANAWVGYVIELDGASYYHAGDTDHAPELDDIKADVTFLPIGGDPFTMGPDEAAGLAKFIAPQIAVPMHYGFAVGKPSDADRFRTAAEPVRVEILTPENPFER
jgi:L-ascorbate metabolism protein UlaG (beta-lactamase superfamily)